MGRRKGNSAFPVARIKKMMQSDDDVGKIATVTPVLVAKALECMMEHVLTEAANVARVRHTKTVTPQHLHYCVANNDHFDFLRPTLAHVSPLEDKPVQQEHVRRTRAKRPRSPPAANVVQAKDDDEIMQDVDVQAPSRAGCKLPSKVASKRHKAPVVSACAPSVSAPALPALPLSLQKKQGGGGQGGGDEEDDDENYDDDDDDDDGGGEGDEEDEDDDNNNGNNSKVKSRPGGGAALSAPNLSGINALHGAAQDADDAKPSKRVSVHALLS